MSHEKAMKNTGGVGTRKTKIPTVGERWEQGIDHDPRSELIARGIAQIDYDQCEDHFCFKFGGDGDNGEELMYLLDVYFAQVDAKQSK